MGKQYQSQQYLVIHIYARTLLRTHIHTLAKSSHVIWLQPSVSLLRKDHSEHSGQWRCWRGPKKLNHLQGAPVREYEQKNEGDIWERERERGRIERKREVYWWGREGGFNRSLRHEGCEMRWWNQRIEGREGGKREGDCVSKCGCLEIGLPTLPND